MKDMLKSRYLKRETKGKLYNTILKAVLIYGSESWTLTKGDEERFRILERKVLRRIYGPTREKEGWQLKYNHELYDLNKNPEIVKTVKLGGLRWLGHLTIANDISPCRKLTFSKPEGTRRAGRPSLRWLDSIEKVLRLLGIRGWKTKALDRSLWRRIMEEAKTHTGL
jgi:hypothetical protein